MKTNSSQNENKELKCKNSIGVQRFVGDAKQTLEIRVERWGTVKEKIEGKKVS